MEGTVISMAHNKLAITKESSNSISNCFYFSQHYTTKLQQLYVPAQNEKACKVIMESIW